jgi:hypothetical protein
MLLPLGLVACAERELGTFNTAPSATILSPLDGSGYDPGTTVEFMAQIGDGQTPAEELTVLWQSDVDGELDDTPADSAGNLYFATANLSSGTHVVTLSVADDGGKSTASSVAINIAPGNSTEGDPTIEIISPELGAELMSTEIQNVIAKVTDDTDPPDTLLVEVLDFTDGLLFSGNPSAAGTVSVPWTFSIGSHELSVTAVDSDGNQSEALTNFEVVDGGRPVITLISPVDGTTYSLGETVIFEANLTDDLTPMEGLAVKWLSDIDGILSEAPADSTGRTVFSKSNLTGGTHTITLKVTDTDGKEASETALITIFDPNAIDDDGDGWTENQGDCDDTNTVVNPDMPEICDDVDNDCDGSINEEDADPYESNDTLATAYDFGNVGDSFWVDETVNLTDVTLHMDSDEDWFVWETGDIIIIDNVNIDVTVTSLPATGTYTVELYDINDNAVVDSASGSGTLRVSYSGDWLDDDETDWAVRIYANSWAPGSCGTLYKLIITS